MQIVFRFPNMSHEKDLFLLSSKLLIIRIIPIVVIIMIFFLIFFAPGGSFEYDFLYKWCVLIYL